MEKRITEWSYWLGILCVVVALIWRGLNTLGLFGADIRAAQTIWHTTVYKAAILFLVTAIATANYTWARSQKM